MLRARGIASVSLDERGRFVVPSRFRDKLKESSGGNLVITADVAHACLLIYPEEEYQKIEDQLIALDNTQSRVRDLQRRFIGFATEVELSDSGRILVATELREYAGLDRKGVLLGQVNKLELWSEPAWEKKKKSWPKERSKERPKDKAKGNDMLDMDIRF